MYAVVLLGENLTVYGPIPDPRTAQRFAQYLTDEVGPAQAYPLTNPTAELLNWRDHVHAKGVEAVDRLVDDARRMRDGEGGTVTPLYPLGTA